MIKDYKKDHIIRSFLDSLYIEKGLSKNTVSSYENDISSFLSWLNNKQINYQQVSGNNINEFISKLFNSGLKSSSINRKISSIKHFYLFLSKKNAADDKAYFSETLSGLDTTSSLIKLPKSA